MRTLCHKDLQIDKPKTPPTDKQQCQGEREKLNAKVPCLAKSIGTFLF